MITFLFFSFISFSFLPISFSLLSFSLHLFSFLSLCFYFIFYSILLLSSLSFLFYSIILFIFLLLFCYFPILLYSSDKWNSLSIPFYSPQMIARHILYVLVHHMQPDCFRMAVTLHAPRLFVTIITLGDSRRGNDSGTVRTVGLGENNGGDHLGERVGQMHLQMNPDHTL